MPWDGDLLEGDGEGVAHHGLGEAGSDEAAEEDLREHDFFKHNERSGLQVERRIEGVNERCDHYPGRVKERMAMEEERSAARAGYLPVTYLYTCRTYLPTYIVGMQGTVPIVVKKSAPTKVPQPVLRHLGAKGL